MNEVILVRAREYNNRGKKIKLYVDNDYYGKIGLDEEIKVLTKNDVIKIRAKIDWCTSKEFKINFDEKHKAVIQIYSSISNSLFIIIFIGFIINFVLSIYFHWKVTMVLLLLFAFIPLYKITIDYSNYLKFRFLK